MKFGNIFTTTYSRVPLFRIKLRKNTDFFYFKTGKIKKIIIKKIHLLLYKEIKSKCT